MKKSEIYKMAQKAVLNSFVCFSEDEKLEILKELMEQEKIEKFCEEREEKEKANEAV